jgi:hypothetical protein
VERGAACGDARRELMIARMEAKRSVPSLESLGFGELAPEGWLRRRLELQERGLGGHIEGLWPDLGPDSAWLGGSGEAWERGPYYLDGLVPLAFLLGETAIIARARGWAEAMLASAREDGSFGPASNLDWWPRTVALKALLAWHEATGDERYLGLMLRYCRYELERLDAEPLSGWAAARGSENALVALELWRRSGEPFLLKLARICLDQELPWDEVFASFPYARKTGAYLPRLPFRAAKALSFAMARLASRNAKPGEAAAPRPRATAKEAARLSSSKLFRHYHFTHNVNYAMAVKRPGLACALALAEGKREGPEAEEARAAALELADSGIESALRYHGLPLGIWTGDEHFSGTSPTQGIELCGIVELMHSLEVLVRLTGEARYADRLELLAFNALPAAFTEDMAGHQYLQQPNQVLVTRAARPWYDNGKEASLFGLEPEFGCCAANFHQGFPKLARSLWLGTEEGGLACAVYADCRARPRAAGGALVLVLRTGYPASSRVEIRVESEPQARTGAEAGVEFPLYLRVPLWAEGMACSVNGAAPELLGPPGSFARVGRDHGPWAPGDRLDIEIPLRLRVEEGQRGAVSIHRGPLLFALGLEEAWSSLRGDPPYDYREARPLSPSSRGSRWNYALVLDPADPGRCLEAREAAEPDLLFRRDAPPVSLIARARLVPSWRLRGASAGPLPRSPLEPGRRGLGPEEELSLVPYACARLRVAEFPWLAPQRARAGSSC